jgi:hypothetical protein
MKLKKVDNWYNATHTIDQKGNRHTVGKLAGGYMIEGVLLQSEMWENLGFEPYTIVQEKLYTFQELQSRRGVYESLDKEFKIRVFGYRSAMDNLYLDLLKPSGYIPITKLNSTMYREIGEEE